MASGIDSLYWSLNGVLPDRELERLEAHRSMAEGAGETVPFLLGGEEFGIEPFGFMRMYKFHLVHPHGRIGVTASKSLPTVYVQPNAEFLHGVGPEACAGWFNELVSGLVPGGVPKASRVDLFMDLQGWDPTPEMRDRFVTRSSHRRVYENDRKMTALQFGKRGSGVHSRIYCKSTEVAAGSVWWHDLWGDAWDAERPVWRIEFEVHRVVLGQLGIDSLDDLFAGVGGIWGYLTEWLSLRVPAADETRSRWPVDPVWEAVSHASLRNGAAGLKRTYGANREASLRRIVVSMRGYMSSYGALIDETDVERLGPCLTSVLHEWEIETGDPFSWQVDRKKRRYGLP
ncbi:MAG: hypothetical protein QY307_01445 [Acidimicrobiia bacterium]|nr:MAG: hypothetical protein QY307_01445 [Acidimicrobiia bacterium]